MRRLITISGAILLAATLVAAGPGHRGKCKGDHAPMHGFCEKLELTDQQKEQMKGLHEDMQKVRDDHHAKMKKQRETFVEVLSAEQPDQARLDELIEGHGEMAREMTAKRIEHLLKIKEVLTPEQFAKLLDKESRGGPHSMGDQKGCKGHHHKGRK